MKNSRETKFRSLKGPRRLLQLDVIDGKRYIKKRDLQKYFFEDKWSISDFKYHFGLGHRIVRGSLYKWFTKEEIDRSHREKISDKQKGDNNSNSVNWYRPSKLISLEELKSSIGKVNNKHQLKEALSLTSYELSFIQQFYNFRLPDKDKILDNKSIHRLTKSDLYVLALILKASGTSEDFLSGDIPRIINTLHQLSDLTFYIRYIFRKLRRIYRKELISNNVTFPTNLIEWKAYKALISMGYKPIPQYYIKKLKIKVDFLINNIVLELDGNLHNIDKDKIRDTKLKKLGYQVIRIDLKKESLNRFSNIKDVKLCIKKYL